MSEQIHFVFFESLETKKITRMREYSRCDRVVVLLHHCDDLIHIPTQKPDTGDEYFVLKIY